MGCWTSYVSTEWCCSRGTQVPSPSPLSALRDRIAFHLLGYLTGAVHINKISVNAPELARKAHFHLQSLGYIFWLGEETLTNMGGWTCKLQDGLEPRTTSLPGNRADHYATMPCAVMIRPGCVGSPVWRYGGLLFGLQWEGFYMQLFPCCTVHGSAWSV